MAKAYLEERGFLFIESNFYTRTGEIDLIMKKRGTIYFIEVKTRFSTNYGFPESAVTKTKIEKIKKTALLYCECNKKYKSFLKEVLVVAIEYYNESGEPDIHIFPLN